MKIGPVAVIGMLVAFAPLLSFASDPVDAPVYQCAGPSDTVLYTNQERSGCQAVTLTGVTIAPALPRPGIPQEAPSPSLSTFPSDWFDNTGSIGSLRNRVMQGGLYGLHEWIDYGAPVGALRNSPEHWPSPYGLYRW